MKVPDFIIHIIKMMWRDFKKNCSSCFRDMQKSAESPIFEWSCTYTGGGGKRVSLQDPKNENTPKFPSIKIWY